MKIKKQVQMRGYILTKSSVIYFNHLEEAKSFFKISKELLKNFPDHEKNISNCSHHLFCYTIYQAIKKYWW